MGDFPQFDFKELDGRQTPFVKPQHYKKGSTTETDLTGHDNPLPTADYGMTESGVWIPKRVDDEGNTLTQVTGSIDEYELPVTINKNVEVLGVFRGEDSTIPPGATTRLLAVDTSKYSDLFLQYRPGRSNDFNNYELIMQWHQGDTNSPSFTYVAYQEESSGGNQESEWFPVKGVKATVAIKNNMELDKSFVDLTVFGRRM